MGFDERCQLRGCNDGLVWLDRQRTAADLARDVSVCQHAENPNV
jgi:hypothetical protein